LGVEPDIFGDRDRFRSSGARTERLRHQRGVAFEEEACRKIGTGRRGTVAVSVEPSDATPIE
jgi:hypothetical protein